MSVPLPSVSNFAVELDFKYIFDQPLGRERDAFSIGFRSNQGGHYALTFETGGEVRLTRIPHEAEGRNLLVLHTLPFQSSKSHHLLLIAQGPQIAASLDAQPLFLVQDETFRRGWFVMSVGNTTDLPFRVQVDNFKVWDITDLP
jgi:hypothetical protein